MSPFSKTHLVVRRRHLVLLCTALISLAGADARAACLGCTTFNQATVWGTNGESRLNEAPGLAISSRNPGVLWSHNDGGNDDGGVGRAFALRTNGVPLARYRMNVQTFGVVLLDVEDMAIGPGPNSGTPYLYVGDIGGSQGLRNEIKIIRIPEPIVVPSTSAQDFTGVQVFTLKYPTGLFWDAETLFVDPVNADLYVGTKANSGTWFYRANLNNAATGSTNLMEFAVYVPFADASGGAISADGKQFVLRSEFFAQTWLRCDGESISNALARPGQNVPFSFAEPNGEAIALLPNGRGYVTISDRPAGADDYQSPIHFFAPTCAPTLITQQPLSAEVSAGANHLFIAEASGENLHYQWRFNGADIPGETTNALWLSGIQPSDSGHYSLKVDGNGGAVTSSTAVLSVKTLPPAVVSQPAVLTLAPTGSTVQLSVDVQGTPPFHYAWTFGRRALNQNSPTLTLTNVARGNSGKYRVTVTNSMGKVTSAYATLKVQYPPVIVGQPLSRTNKINSNASFRVRVKGSPRLRYQWFYEGTAISNAVRSSLSLRRVQPAQSGQYSVRITNSVGTALSLPAQLTVP